MTKKNLKQIREDFNTALQTHHDKVTDWLRKFDNLHISHPAAKKQASNFSSITGHIKVHKALGPIKDLADNDQLNSIDRYTQSSRYINDTLHRHLDGTKPLDLTDDEQNTVNHLDNIISNPKNVIQHNVSAYSGISFDPRKHINSDGLMHSPAYISTSINKETAHSFAKNDRTTLDAPTSEKHLIHFHLKPNDPAVYIAHHSTFPDERELLIKRNVVLKHHGSQIIPYRSTSGVRYVNSTANHQLIVHHMTIHNP